MSLPSNTMEPAVASMSRSSSRPTVVLPQPDSPTRPSVSPRWMTRSTPSTARTSATCRWSTPARTGKAFTRPLMSTRGRGIRRRGPGGRRRRAHSARRSWSCLGPIVGIGSQAAVLMVVEPASDPVTRHHLAQVGMDVRGQHVVVVDARRAAGCEPAAVRQRDEIGHAARDDRQLIQQHARHRHRADEAAGVGMLRLPEQRCGRRSAPRSRRHTSRPPGRPSRRPRPGRG